MVDELPLLLLVNESILDIALLFDLAIVFAQWATRFNSFLLTARGMLGRRVAARRGFRVQAPPHFSLWRKQSRDLFALLGQRCQPGFGYLRGRVDRRRTWRRPVHLDRLLHLVQYLHLLQ